MVRARASRVIVAAVLTASGVAAVPAAARAKLSCASSGSTVIANSQARVFRRGTVTSGETKGAPLYYGCSRSTGHIRRLNRDGDFGINPVTGSRIRLAGPFVGYVENDVHALGVEPTAIVVDVRHGQVIRDPQGSDTEFDVTAIVGLVVTQRGTEAWIASDCVRSMTEPMECAEPMTTEYRVTISDSTTGTGQFGERLVAHSVTIAPHSLALASNSHAIYWTDAGVAQTTAIH